MDSNFFGPKIIVPKLYLKLEFDTEDQVLFFVSRYKQNIFDAETFLALNILETNLFATIFPQSFICCAFVFKMEIVTQVSHFWIFLIWFSTFVILYSIVLYTVLLSVIDSYNLSICTGQLLQHYLPLLAVMNITSHQPRLPISDNYFQFANLGGMFAKSGSVFFRW